MKKNVLAWCFMFLFAIAGSYAQQTQRERKTPEERQKEQIEQLTKALDLNADQQKKITTIFENDRKEMKKMRESMKEKSREEQQKTFKAQQDKKEKEIKKVLSEEQIKKYDEYKKQQQKKFQGRQQGNRPPRNGNRPNGPRSPIS